MATSKIQVTEGSGKNLATNSITEDAVTKEVSRVVVNDSTGAEVTVATAAKQDTGNSSLSTIATNTGNIPASPATTAKQDTGNTSLASIDSKITAVNTGAVTISAALPAGTNAIGKLAANSGVDIGDVDVTTVGTITPGTAATNLGKAEDDVHTSGDVGVMALAVRNDGIATTLANSNGDYSPIAVNSVGAVAVGSATTSATSLAKAEDAAHSSGDVGVMALAVRTDTLAASSGTTGDYETIKTDANGAVWNSLGTLVAGEDLTANVLKTEQRFSYSTVATADVQIKGGAGFLHSITFTPNDATPTAGSIIVYDSLTETGTQMFNWNVQATAFIPFTVILDYTFSTGCYLGFTTTNDVNVSCAYR